jgi:hypothetical protein
MDTFIWKITVDTQHSNIATIKGNVKCQFGMAAHAKRNLQAAENEPTE